MFDSFKSFCGLQFSTLTERAIKGKRLYFAYEKQGKQAQFEFAYDLFKSCYGMDVAIVFVPAPCAEEPITVDVINGRHLKELRADRSILPFLVDLWRERTKSGLQRVQDCLTAKISLAGADYLHRVLDPCEYPNAGDPVPDKIRFTTDLGDGLRTVHSKWWPRAFITVFNKDGSVSTNFENPNGRILTYRELGEALGAESVPVKGERK